MAFLDIDDFKLRAGITGSTYDTPIAAMLAATEESIAEYLGYTITSPAAAVTKYFDGMGQTQLVLTGIGPVNSITSVWEDAENRPPVYGDNYLLTAGEDYYLLNDRTKLQAILVRLNGVWPYEVRRRTKTPPALSGGVAAYSGGPIKVTMNVGWDTVPGPVSEAGYAEAASRWTNRATGSAGVRTSGSLNGASWSQSGAVSTGGFGERFPGLLTPYAAILLQPYRDLSVGLGSGQAIGG